MNLEIAEKVLKDLANQGLKTVCLCPGARCAPFVEVLSKTDHFEVISFFDERSAGFFAFGRARKNLEPVAVITTSGTAVSELLSPMIEAFYNEVPLVVVSADRPKRLRGTGAPQAIRQSDLLTSYSAKVWDIESLEQANIELVGKGPFHVNVCFDEPLVSGQLELSFTCELPYKKTIENLNSPSVRLDKALVVVSGLNEKNKDNVFNQIKDMKAPIFYEASSGLRERASNQSNTLLGGEKMLVEMIRMGAVKSVLRIGDVPLGRYWRDLDSSQIEVHSVSEKPFAGLSQGNLYLNDLSIFDLSSFDLEDWDFLSFVEKGRKQQDLIGSIVGEFPKCEPNLFSELSKSIENSDSIYIGNSLPVRLWDLFAFGEMIPRVNRGANGIDGQISSAFGAMEPGSGNWVVLGDLTTLYDSNAFFQSDYLRAKKIDVNLVVVNNGGGQIFDRIFDNPLYKNEHNIGFQSLSEMWGWQYQELTDWKDMSAPNGLRIIEALPDENQTGEFWERYDQLWR